VKLFAVAGLYFGWQQGLFLVIVACIVGLVTAVVALSDPKTLDSKDNDSADGDEKPRGLIPFGPSIAVACIITMLVGQPFINWYLSLLA
jgi:leader peptidase (prepilin peptidase)/N-methyltransferase